MNFAYGAKETDALSGRDKRLGEAIERIGPIQRAVDDSLFESVVHQILGQQISTAALATLWRRLTAAVQTVDAEGLLALGRNGVQAIGTTFKKADYVLAFAQAVQDGSLSLDELTRLPDEEVVRRLSALDGVGVWTGEMILIFGMQRPDVVSFGDLAILRGMRMLYRHRSIDRARFERYRRRYSPYGTVASLYLWAIAGGAIPELNDPARAKK